MPVPAEHEEQRDAADHRRQHQRHGDQRAEHGAATDPGAGEHPGQRHAEHHRDSRGQAWPRAARAAAPDRPRVRPGRAAGPTTAPGRPARPAAGPGRRSPTTAGTRSGRGTRPCSLRRRAVASRHAGQQITAPLLRRGRPEAGVRQRLLAVVGEHQVHERLRGVGVGRRLQRADRVLVDRLLRLAGTRCPRPCRRPRRRRRRRPGRRRPRRAPPWSVPRATSSSCGVGHGGDAGRLEDLGRGRTAGHVGRADGQRELRLGEVGQAGDACPGCPSGRRSPGRSR